MSKMFMLLTILTPFLIAISCIASAFFGGVAGWIVGFVFEDTILGILAQMGITNVTMFQVGAFLGFVTSFLKETIKVSK